MAENSEAEPGRRGLGRPFPRGVSGNPGGRPRRLRELEAAIDEAHVGSNVLEVIDKLHGMALDGDVHAARVYLDRVLGPVRPRPDTLPPLIPNAETTLDLQRSVRRLLADQLLALQQKAQNEGLTDTELLILRQTIKAIRDADRDVESLRVLASIGFGG